jgi:hypothetical protein
MAELEKLTGGSASAGEGLSERSGVTAPVGFISLSEDRMNWADAVAFCKHHGGKLPRINNSDSWDGKNPPQRGILIDGFGYGDGPGVGLSADEYWTGTDFNPGKPDRMCTVFNCGGEVVIQTEDRRSYRWVVCVP